MKSHGLFSFVSLVVLLAGCPGKKDGHRAEPGSGSGALPLGSGSAADVILPPAAPLPEPPPGLPPLPQGPTVTPEQVALGELLFFDGRLAADGTTACATCHDPDADWSGAGRQNNALGRPNLRRAPSLADLAWRADKLGWDGRYTTVDKLLFQHIRGQQGVDASAAITKIAALPVYRAHFQRAFAADPDGGRLLAALAAYARTRYTAPGAWTEAEQGTAPAPGKAATPMARGYVLFTGKAQCGECHLPPLYSDGGYHRLGLIAQPDDGRGKVDPLKKGAFRTPSLRGAALRKTFFHDGSATSLDAAIDWHLAGGTGQGADPSIVDLPKVTLSAAERADLDAFVRALSPARTVPYPRPILPQ
jgi:cytochrome c peroxidase